MQTPTSQHLNVVLTDMASIDITAALPLEIQIEILSRLSIDAQIQAARVCTLWSSIILSSAFRRYRYHSLRLGDKTVRVHSLLFNDYYYCDVSDCHACSVAPRKFSPPRRAGVIPGDSSSQYRTLVTTELDPPPANPLKRIFFISPVRFDGQVTENIFNLWTERSPSPKPVFKDKSSNKDDYDHIAISAYHPFLHEPVFLPRDANVKTNVPSEVKLVYHYSEVNFPKYTPGVYSAGKIGHEPGETVSEIVNKSLPNLITIITAIGRMHTIQEGETYQARFSIHPLKEFDGFGFRFTVELTSEG